jgi:hypothetical protein
MDRGFSFRLLYRVVFFCFCLTFACFYHGGGSGYGKREDKTEPNKSKDEFKGKPVNVDVSLEKVERVSNLTENDTQLMDQLPNEQNFDLDKSRQKFHHCLKKHHKISNI